MFRNIMVPIDGSALSRKAVKKAVALAKLSGAKITGFHVAPAYKFNVYADYIPPNFVMPKDFETRARKIAEKHLEVVKKEAAAAGGTLDDCAKVNVYLIDLGHFAKVNEIMAGYFHEPYPARAAVGARATPNRGWSTASPGTPRPPPHGIRHRVSRTGCGHGSSRCGS